MTLPANPVWNICNESNMDQALKLLKEELFILGYPTFLDCSTDSSNPYLLIDLINVSWNLTKEIRKRRSETKDSLKNNFNKLDNQLELLELRKKVDILENQNKKQHNELQYAISFKDRAEKDVAHAKENIEKLKKVINFNNNQHCVKIRKYEVEIKSLRGKFEKSLKTGAVSDEKTEIKRVDVNLNQYDTSNSIELLKESHKKVVCNLEKSIETLVEENINLRNLMERLGHTISNLHEKISSNKNGSTVCNESELSDHIFQLPCEEIEDAIDSYFETLAQNIETSFNELIKKL